MTRLHFVKSARKDDESDEDFEERQNDLLSELQNISYNGE